MLVIILFYWNGVECIPCASECHTCHGTTNGECDYCLPPYFLLEGHCISCSSPLIQIIPDLQRFRYCIYPCKSDEYLYDDGTCHATCDSFYWNIVTQYNKQFCKYTCGPGQKKFWNANCSPNPCNFPLQMIQYGGYEVCRYPCPLGEYLYENETCHSAHCLYPLYPITYNPYGSFDVCEPKCTHPTPYRHNNDSCRADCLAPLEPLFIENAHVCGPPMCGVVICDKCDMFPCKEAYVCHPDLGFFCLPIFEYRLDVTHMRQTLNGHIFSIQVVPTQLGIPNDSNDYLLFSLQGLDLNVDYIYELTHLGVGIFQLKIEVLRALNGVTLIGDFHYSPTYLGLRVITTIPRVVFISQAIQDTGKTVGNASQAAFLLLILSVIAMLLDGGLASLWTALPDGQYTYYLLFLNINYLYHTEKYLEALSNFDLFGGAELKPLDIEDKELKRSLPERFYLIHYMPDFYTNAYPIFVQSGIMALYSQAR